MLAAQDTSLQLAVALEKRAIETGDSSLHDLMVASAEELRRVHQERDEAWAQLEDVPAPPARHRARETVAAWCEAFAREAVRKGVPRKARERFAEKALLLEQVVALLEE